MTFKRPERGVFVPTKPGDNRSASEIPRRYRRVSLHRKASFRLPDGEWRDAALLNLSVRGAALRAAPCAIIGDRVSLRIDDIGQIEGVIAGMHHNGFGVSFIADKQQRLALADTLTWALNRIDHQTRPRRTMTDVETVIETETGRVALAEVVDVSTSGAYLRCALQARIGTSIMVGRRRAIVVRHHRDGMGVSFVTPTK